MSKIHILEFENLFRDTKIKGKKQKLKYLFYKLNYSKFLKYVNFLAV